MASLAELTNVTARLPRTTGSRNVLSAAGVSRDLAKRGGVRGGGVDLIVTLRGQRVVTEDLFTIAREMPGMVNAMVGYFGEVLVNVSREIHTPNIDTQATYDSISAGPGPGDPMQTFPLGPFITAVDVGPFTSYSKFLEFGFVHHLSGEFIHNPFMIPASDIITKPYYDAMTQLVQVSVARRRLSGMAAASPASGILSSIRSALYATSKLAGDLQVFGIRGLSGVRGFALAGARGLGDVNAGMRGAIGHRITRRVAGRFAAGGLRTSLSTTLTGPSSAQIDSSTRLYNRISGRGFGALLRGL